jgi:hypothetical protein
MHVQIEFMGLPSPVSWLLLVSAPLVMNLNLPHALRVGVECCCCPYQASQSVAPSVVQWRKDVISLLL